jgi:hypothetical protein
MVLLAGRGDDNGRLLAARSLWPFGVKATRATLAAAGARCRCTARRSVPCAAVDVPRVPLAGDDLLFP